MASRCQGRSAKAFSNVVKHSVPRSSARSPRLRGASTRRESRSEPGTHAVRVHAKSFRWQTSVGHIAGLVPPTKPWKSGALAGRKLSAPPDAERERRKGETVCGRAVTTKRCTLVRTAGFGSQTLDTTEGVLGLSPVLPSRVRRSEVLRLGGESLTGQRIGRHRGRSGVPPGNHENVRGRRVSVKAPPGPNDRGESASSARKGAGERCAGMRFAKADGSE